MLCHNVRMNLTNIFLRCAVLLFLVSSAMLAAQAPAAPGAPPPTSETAALVKQAQQLNSEGKQDEALATYRKALEISPNDVDAHLGMGSVLDLKGDYAEARRHLAKAIEVASAADAKERAWRTMALSYVFECNMGEAGRLEQLVFDARMARQDFLSAADVANETARLYLECGDVDTADKWYGIGYQTAIRKTDMSEADKNLWLFRSENAQARIAARRGQREDAEKHVSAAKVALDKANNPDQARFYPYLTGYVAFYGGDYKTAIADLQQADQRDPFILSLLAQAYEKSGDQTRATDYYRKVLASNAHNPTNAFARPLAKKKLATAKP
jgi:tetratricopeptide (TPR) repeat protein